MQKRIYIFDLDGTVINSAHRTPFDDKGNLILDEYVKLATPDNIMRDTLFPLAAFMRRKISNGRDLVVICTARHMSDADFEYLSNNAMRPGLVYSRNGIDKEHYYMSDAEYKVKHLEIFQRHPYENAHKIMFEDNAAVIQAVSLLPNFTVIPIKWE